MKIIVEINLNDMSCKILKLSNLTKKDIITVICNYFNIPISELRKRPKERLIQKEDYVLCRKFISYFLYNKLSLTYYEIGRFLAYSITNQSNSIVGKNINDITEAVENQDQQIIRSYNNLNKLLDKLIAS